MRNSLRKNAGSGLSGKVINNCHPNQRRNEAEYIFGNIIGDKKRILPKNRKGQEKEGVSGGTSIRVVVGRQ